MANKSTTPNETTSPSTCTCGGVYLGPYPGSHLPGCPDLGGRRGVTEAEYRLMRHDMLFGSDGWPINKLKRGWTWGTAYVPGPPVVFKTKRLTVASFQAFMGVLRDAIAGRI